MKNLTTCRFCDIVAGKYEYTEIDEPFAVSKEFLAVASIGALVEGWSLIIPREHQLSMRNIYARSSFTDFLTKIIPLLVNKYGSVIAFEHGANKEGSITACGTDHAHMHLVPFGESLTADLETSGMQWIQCHASEIALRAEDKEYLFYCELDAKRLWKDTVGYLHILAYPLSQYFRQLIADRRGSKAISDYKLFPHLDISMKTRRTLIGSAA